MRRRALASLVAVMGLTVASLPASGAAPPRWVEHVKHRVSADVIVAGAVPGRPGNFHTVDVRGGYEVDMPLGAEETSALRVAVEDFACPETTTLATFAESGCVSVGQASSAGTQEVPEPFSEDVIGSSVRLQGTVIDGVTGDPLGVDLTFVLDETAPLTVFQVASDSTYTWTHLGTYGSLVPRITTATGTVAGIPVGGDSTRQLVVRAAWDVARGRPPQPGDIQPPVPGWKLDDFPVRGWAYATFSTTGWMPGIPGNYHVFDWYVGTENGYNEVEVANYRCPDPAAVYVDDPLASGCVTRAASFGEAEYLPLWKVGHSLALRYDDSTPKFTQVGAPSVVFGERNQPGLNRWALLEVRADCAISGAEDWEGVGRVRFASPTVTFHDCRTTTQVEYRPDA